MRIRPAVQEDAQAMGRVVPEAIAPVYEVLGQGLQPITPHESARNWANALGDLREKEVVLVAEDGGDILGLAMCGPADRNPVGVDGEIFVIAVLPSAQGRGVGRALAVACAQHLAEHGLTSMVIWALVQNPSAIAFYERLGARPTRRRTIVDEGVKLPEIAYCWDDLGALIAQGTGTR